ncbi:protein of unknown function [Megasphaera paucivorans]|uniref:Uncharacterized protein n=1 Tax=Megasphaera paucivorans TaxID=349095 RepID=A0A1G9RHP9_9FIRM|nr:DUF4020 domain-containing protein [Megasphaera paucivorans]SDM22723.1 protein of unknown function [Megasphaera paucivorans]
MRPLYIQPKAKFKTFISPIQKEELLNKKPSEIIDFLIEFKENSVNLFNEPSRCGLITVVAEVVASNFDWGVSLFQILSQKELWKSDLWGGIFEGFEKGKILPEQWEKILSLIEQHKDLLYIGNNVAKLLLSSIQKESDGIPLESIIHAECFAYQLLKIYIDEGEVIDDTISEKWAEEAINNTGGKLTEFILHSISKIHKNVKYYNGLTKDNKAYFELILESDCYAAQMVWDKWLQQYLKNRIEGVPLALEDKEIEEMIGWLPFMNKHIPEFVSYICNVTIPCINDVLLYWKIDKKKLAKQYPDDIAKLLNCLIMSANCPFSPRDTVAEIVGDLISARADETSVRLIIDSLARLGLESAPELRNSILTSNSSVILNS